MALDPNQGYTVSGSSIQKMRTAIDDVASLKQQVKQVQSQYLPGLPDEIIVPRSYDSGTQIYTVDVYIHDPVTGSLVRKLTGQTAKLFPATVAP